MTKAYLMTILLTSAGAGQAEHPRLFFPAKDLPALQGRAKTTHRHHVEVARTMFEWDVRSNPKPPESPTGLDNWPIEPWTARMVNATFLWAVTGDEDVLAQARTWLAALCRCRAAADNSYTYGFYAIALATAYDVLHDALPREERDAVRTHLAAVAQGLFESGTGRARGWWRRLYIHHDYWIPTAGLGVAALALKDEDPRWRTWYDLARRELTYALSILGEDGAWPEGVSGWCYAMSAMLPFAEASRNVAGDDLYRFAWMRQTAVGRLHLRLPAGGYFFYGDSYRDGGYGGMGSTPVHSLQLLAAQLGDGHAQWLAQEEETAAFARVEKARADERTGDAPPDCSRFGAFYSTGWSLIWYDPAVNPVPPDDLPTHQVFDNLGYVTARTGWRPDAALLSFRAGAVMGERARQAALDGGDAVAERITESVEHAHTDRNAITFFSRGTYALSPPGYGARGSARHATLLINGRQQVKGLDAARLLRREFAEDHVYLLGEAAPAYPPDLGVQRFHRHVVWLKPDVLVICDDVRTEKPAAVQWRLHPGERLPVSVEGKRIVVKSAKEGAAAALALEFLLPARVAGLGPATQPTSEEERERKTLRQLVRMTYAGAATVEPATRTLFLVVAGPAEAVKARSIEVTGGAGRDEEERPGGWQPLAYWAGPKPVPSQRAGDPLETLPPGTGPAGRYPGAGALVELGDRRWAVVFGLEPLGGPETVRMSWTLPDERPTLIVGLPSAVSLDVTRTAERGGAVTVTLAPGKEVETSFEGTLGLGTCLPLGERER